MTGRVTGHKHGVNVIVGDDCCVYFNYGKPLSYGTEVYFEENANDPEVADGVRPISENSYTLRELVVVMIIGMLIGAALSFMTASRVYGAPIIDSDKALMVQTDELNALAVELELQQRTRDSVLYFRRGRG